MNIVDLLVNLLDLPEALLNQTSMTDDQQHVKLPIFIKYAIRCLTSAARHPQGVDQLVVSNQGSSKIMKFIQVIRDEEIMANCAKITRIIYRDDKVSNIYLIINLMC